MCAGEFLVAVDDEGTRGGRLHVRSDRTQMVRFHARLRTRTAQRTYSRHSQGHYPGIETHTYLPDESLTAPLELLEPRGILAESRERASVKRLYCGQWQCLGASLQRKKTCCGDQSGPHSDSCAES